MTTQTAPPTPAAPADDAPRADRPARRAPSGTLVRALAGVALVAVLACLPLLAIHVPGVLPGPTYTPGALQMMAMCWLIGALALSYHLLFGVAGLLSFGHALYFAAGLYGLAIVLDTTEIPLLPAAALVLVGGIVLAHVVGAISLRVTGISFAMVTLAFAQAGNVLVRRNPGGATGGEEGLALATRNVPDAFVGVLNTRNLYWLALAVLVVVYLVVLWVERSRAGHVAAATRENEMRVRVIGGRPYLVKLLVFVLAATLATVVGMAYLLLQSGPCRARRRPTSRSRSSSWSCSAASGPGGARSSAASSTRSSTSGSGRSRAPRRSRTCRPCCACRSASRCSCSGPSSSSS